VIELEDGAIVAAKNQADRGRDETDVDDRKFWASPLGRVDSLVTGSFSARHTMYRLAHLGFPRFGRQKPGAPVNKIPPRRDGRHALVKNATMTAMAMALCGWLAMTGLGNQALWDDEANTALFARNVRTMGELTAWDGQNLVGYALGAELNASLHNIYMPPLQYYVAALSQDWFGDDTAGNRRLFVVLGITSLALLTVFAHQHLPQAFPAWLPAWFLAVSPAYLLVIRNCRYYALGIFLFTLLLCLWPRPGSTKIPWARVFGASVVTGLLVSTHYLFAVSSVATLGLLWLLSSPRGSLSKRFENKAHVATLLGSGVALVAALTYVVLKRSPFDVPPETFFRGLSFFRTDSSPDIPQAVLRIGVLWHYLRGLGRFEFLPVLLLVAVYFVPRFSPRFKPLAQYTRDALPWLDCCEHRARPRSVINHALCAHALPISVVAAVRGTDDSGLDGNLSGG
jgi:hypothetical protein